MLLDCQREIRAAFDGGVIRDDDALASLDDPDAGHDSRRRRRPLIQLPGGERTQLEEGAARIDEPVDPLAGGELAAGTMPLGRLLAAAARHFPRPLAELPDEPLHPLAPALENLVLLND